MSYVRTDNSDDLTGIPMGIPVGTPHSHAQSHATIGEALRFAGGFGRFQWRVLGATIFVWQCNCFCALLPVLLLPRLETEWALSDADLALVNSAYFVGQFWGQLLVGPASDRFGRRACVCLLVPASYLSGLAHFACGQLKQLVAVRAVSGAVSGGMVIAVSVVAMELCPADRRAFVTSVGFAVGWVGGLLLLVGVDWLAADRPWQWLAVAGLVPTPLALAYLPESPQFLLAAGRADAALAALRRIARVNGASLGEMFLVKEREPGGGGGGGGGGGEGEGGGVQASISPLALAPQLALSGLAWCASTIAYYGIVLWPISLGDGLRLQTTLGALIELPVYVAVPLLSRRLGPRITWVIFLAFAAAVWSSLAVIGGGGAAGTAMLLAARLAGTGATTICYVASNDAFPTAARGFGVAVASCCGRVGSVLAPLIVNLMPEEGGSRMAALATLAGGGALAAFGLSRAASEAS